MPLSEHEQRLLEQIERALVDDDPKFASSVRSGDRRLKARRKLQIGFLVMFVGGPILVVLNYKNATGAPEAAGAAPANGTRPATGRKGRARRQPLKNRLEERFRRRYDQ